MDRYSLNRSDCRSRCQRPPAASPTPFAEDECPCSCEEAYSWCRDADRLPLAMAYVPVQELHTLFEPCKALSEGTAFPDLCKPFCGKRGVCR